MKKAGILSPRFFFRVFKVIRVFKDFKEKTPTPLPDLKVPKDPKDLNLPARDTLSGT